METKRMSDFVSMVFMWTAKFIFAAFILLCLYFFISLFPRIDANNFGYYVEIIRSLVWPIFVILILILFKDPLKIFIDKMRIRLTTPNGATLDLFKEQQQSTQPFTTLDNFETLNSKVKTLETKTSELTAQKDGYWLGYHMERTYRLIFGSQLEILNLTLISEFIPKSKAFEIYSKTDWPAKGYYFESYIGFMVQNGLITPENPDGNYSIQPIGRVFHGYLLKNSLQFENKLPY